MGKTIGFLALLGLFVGGCASRDKGQVQQKSNLTHGMITSSVVKGKTTQTEIIQLFGSPNITTKNREGQEVWTYSKQSSSAQSGRTFGGILIVGGESAYSNTSTDTFDFIVTFDANSVVEDYSVVSSQF